MIGWFWNFAFWSRWKHTISTKLCHIRTRGGRTFSTFKDYFLVSNSITDFFVCRIKRWQRAVPSIALRELHLWEHVLSCDYCLNSTKLQTSAGSSRSNNNNPTAFVLDLSPPICPAVPQKMNAQASSSAPSSAVGTTVTYTCTQTGQSFNNGPTATITCQQNGQWSTLDEECTSKWQRSSSVVNKGDRREFSTRVFQICVVCINFYGIGNILVITHWM